MTEPSGWQNVKPSLLIWSTILAALVIIAVALMTIPLDPFWRVILWILLGFGIVALAWCLLFVPPLQLIRRQRPISPILRTALEIASEATAKLETARALLSKAAEARSVQAELERIERLRQTVLTLARDQGGVASWLSTPPPPAEDRPEPLYEQLQALWVDGDELWAEVTGLVDRIHASTDAEGLTDILEETAEQTGLVEMRAERHDAGVAEMAVTLGAEFPRQNP